MKNENVKMVKLISKLKWNKGEVLGEFENLTELKRHLKRVYNLKIELLEDDSLHFNIAMINLNYLSNTWLSVSN